MDSEVAIRPLEPQDIRAFYPQGLPQTVKGWAVDYRGELACIAGVIFQKPLMIAFSQVRPGLDVSRRLIWRTALELWENIKGLGYPTLYAIADPGLPGAPALLRRLGFIQIESGVRGEVFKWQIL